MRCFLIAVLLVVGGSAQLAGNVNQLTSTRFGTRKHRPITTPVPCLIRERFERPGTPAAAINTCAATFCGCIGGIFNNNSLECSTPFTPPLVDCEVLRTCWPDYTGCVQNVVPGCVFSMVDQCMEDIQYRCDEGAICRSGFIPGGLSAGAIFAITGGIIYCCALLCCIGICVAGRKKRQPDFEP